MIRYSIEQVKAIARNQLDVELFAEAVEKEKAKMRARVPLWHRLFPFHISITRRS